MAEPVYQRLTRARGRQGVGAALFSRWSLWLGEDHVLSVESTGYSERYKRFYFRDIQAITLTQTSWWIYWGMAMGVLAGVFGAIALFSGEIVLAYIFAPVAALFFFATLYDFVLGPSCICELRTAVQTEQLPSLNRVPRALKVLGRLRAPITAAQGELNQAEIPGAALPVTASPEAPPVIVTAEAAEASPAPAPSASEPNGGPASPQTPA